MKKGVDVSKWQGVMDWGITMPGTWISLMSRHARHFSQIHNLMQITGEQWIFSQVQRHTSPEAP